MRPWIACLILLPPLFGRATTADDPAGTDAAPAAQVQVEHVPLRFGSVSLYTENDKYLGGTDEHYTNGLKLSLLSTNLRSFKDESAPDPVRGLSRLLDGLVQPDQSYKVGLTLGQNLYTPANTATSAAQPNDRPYAAWMYFGIAFHLYRPADASGQADRLDVFEINGGMVGPAALGRPTQNGFHDIINVAHAEGWEHQIKNEPGLDLVYERKYRFATSGARTGWGADVIPHAGLSVGNIFTYANVGGEARAGWCLPSDFGSNLIRPSGDSNSPRRAPFNVLLFAATDARAVARDITLDGNTFSESASVDKNPFVADLYAGASCGTTHWQLTYAQAYRTREFKGQDHLSVFGSLSLTFFY
jgi:hypothetical protein